MTKNKTSGNLNANYITPNEWGIPPLSLTSVHRLGDLKVSAYVPSYRPGAIIRRKRGFPYHYVGSVWDGDTEICIFWIWNKYGRYRSYIVADKASTEKEFV